jgi:hypothetical protein
VSIIVEERYARITRIPALSVTVYDSCVLHCHIMFDGQVTSAQSINLLNDGEYYCVIANMTVAMAKLFVCAACNKGCERGAQYRCDASCDVCSVISPCIQDIARNPATSVKDTLEILLASKTTNVRNYLGKPCASLRDPVASVVSWKEGIKSAINGIARCA